MDLLLFVGGKETGFSLPGACVNPRLTPDRHARVCISVAML